ncbi:flagellar brake protein [Salidesulfovibrio onnuriiensis]|uniref:flagellar brake protein n=1 Tax=Salidesulfovibrio onnuriiensis TaxID=2583823 RepID=UPI0011CB9441|nr:flagellar brake protein [Salidesulfovibrio onnuriiensis]
MITRLKTELYSKMILEFPPVRERMSCRFIGVMPDEFVAVRVPLVPGIKERLQEGAIVDFRYLHEGNLMGFRTEVLYYQATPYSIVFVRYPDAIEKHELRKEKRVRCRLRTTVTKKELSWKGVTVDISGSGCHFLVDASAQEAPAVRVGDFVSGIFHTICAMELSFKAKVVSAGQEDSRFSLGLVFEGNEEFPPGEFFDSLKETAELLGD